MFGVPAIAPHLSVAQLPNYLVCIYSEGRKTFLRGRIFSSILSRIDGKTSASEVRDTLLREYPAAQIDNAIRLLEKRGFIIPTALCTPVFASALWAGIGLSAVSVWPKLENCRVRVENFGVAGADALSKALRAISVPEADDENPDLLIAVVPDYLDPRLELWNQSRLADLRRWIPVKPTGVVPLLGPVFQPGRGACWSCLAERLRRNRQVEKFVARASTGHLYRTGLPNQILNPAAVELIAIEIAKAIASAFRTPLTEYALSFDLCGGEIVRHFVTRRPQCPACGSANISSPREPTPLPFFPETCGCDILDDLEADPAAATVEEFQKHISPLTGVITKIEEVPCPVLGMHIRLAHQNFDPDPPTYPDLRQSVAHSAAGTGSTVIQARASAIGEAIERYSGVFQGNEPRIRASYEELGSKAIDPRRCMLFSELQYARAMHEASSAWRAPDPFDESAVIEWSPVQRMTTGEMRYLPTGLLYYFYRGDHASQFVVTSNGAAAGRTLQHAFVNGFLELVERDALSIWWYNKLVRPAVDLDAIDADAFRRIWRGFQKAGRKLWFLDITNDLGIPAFVAVSESGNTDLRKLDFAAGAHFSPGVAALRAASELCQHLGMAARSGNACRSTVALPRTESRTALASSPGPHLFPAPHLPPARPRPLGFAEKGNADAERCLQLAHMRHIELYALEQTRPDLGLPVMRVIAPDLRPSWPRFAPGRLFDVPLRLGWLAKRTPEEELNQLVPHP
jgi:ribosomal protein S12 methylthiotransferase accessory factor